MQKRNTKLEEWLERWTFKIKIVANPNKATVSRVFRLLLRAQERGFIYSLFWLATAYQTNYGSLRKAKSILHENENAFY